MNKRFSMDADVTGKTVVELETKARLHVARMTGRPVERLTVPGGYRVQAIATMGSDSAIPSQAARARREAAGDDTLYAMIGVSELSYPVSPDTTGRLAKLFTEMLMDGTLGLRWMNNAGIGPKPEGVTLEDHLEGWLRHGS